MSGSEPGEMAPESSKAVVFSKFDMQIYTFELTSSELRQAVEEYCIPSDLYPRLPLYRRAVPEAMPWRHGDTDLHDDFLIGYDDHDVARLSDFLVPLRPPPGHILYVCGLTTLCRHPELRYDIKDQDKNANFREGIALILLPSWTGTVVSRGDPIPEDQRPKPRVTPPLGTGVKIPELTTFQKSLEKPNLKIVVAREKKEQQSLAKAEAKRVVPKGTSHVKKEVVDLSGNTRVLTPPTTTIPPSPYAEHHDTQEHAASDGHEDEPVNNRYVPNWGLCNDLRVCTFRACRELVSHLATLAEVEFLGNISNVEVAEEKIRGLKREKLALSAEVAQAEADRQQLVREFIPAVVKRLHATVEYRKSLAAPEGKHRELFTMSCPYVQKVVDSYGLPMTKLLKVSLDVPSSVDGETASSVAAEEASQQSPSSPPKVTSETSFGTTT
ncbi:hypothetical protein Tco_0998251 [Tanacetum coccineum]